MFFFHISISQTHTLDIFSYIWYTIEEIPVNSLSFYSLQYIQLSHQHASNSQFFSIFFCEAFYFTHSKRTPHKTNQRYFSVLSIWQKNAKEAKTKIESIYQLSATEACAAYNVQLDFTFTDYCMFYPDSYRHINRLSCLFCLNINTSNSARENYKWIFFCKI